MLKTMMEMLSSNLSLLLIPAMLLFVDIADQYQKNFTPVFS